MLCGSETISKKFDCGHMTAVANGGSNDISNLKPICSSCNKSMGTKNMDDFKKEFYESNQKKSFNAMSFNNFARVNNSNYHAQLLMGDFNRKGNNTIW